MKDAHAYRRRNTGLVSAKFGSLIQRKSLATWLICCAVAVLAFPTPACINDHDSDSLAKQAKPLPDLLDIIVGRFPRNPPLYYQMRIDRELPEVAKNPRLFGDYDDVAAAYDKLGNPAKALAWMARKKAALPAYDWRNPAIKDAWYRYYANDGTFRVHAWLRSGAKKAAVGEMDQACDEIQKAIEINPHAHFGREPYQLMVMQWIEEATRNPAGASPLSQSFQPDIPNFGTPSPAVEKSPGEAAKGLSSLVVLGGAWESPDIFDALSVSLGLPKTVTLGYMAQLRCKELLESGKQSVIPSSLTVDYLQFENTELDMSHTWTVNRANRLTLEKLFTQIRASADAWQANRTAFMISRLQAGRHPDTDPRFWDGYMETPRLDIDVTWLTTSEVMAEESAKENWEREAWIVGLTAVALLGCLFFGVLIVREQRRAL